MDLSTTYLGLKLRTPLVPSACGPLSNSLDKVRKLEDAGASAIVMYSLFEEEILHETLALDYYLSSGTESYAEALSYFPQSGEYLIGPEGYLEHLYRSKQAAGVPIIGSLNGVSLGGWIDYARKIEQTGVDALELNIYYLATDPDIPGVEIEQRYASILEEVKKHLHIPVAVKLSPYFSSLANLAKRLSKAGADGLVLFNRFYQPDIDLEALEVMPNILLSGEQDLRLPMRWIAILHGKIPTSLAASGGIHTEQDALKMLMAGADVTMLCAVLLKYGLRRIVEIERGMIRWMEEHEYDSVEQMKGSMSHRSCPEPAAFERANYMKAVKNYVTRYV